MSGIGTYVAIGDSFTEGLHDPGPDGPTARTGAGPTGWPMCWPGGKPGFRYANLAIRGKLLGQVIAEQVPRASSWRPTW